MTIGRQRWHIFTKVIDNFGDAGVSWRLARLLAAEHDIDVTLWIDQVAALRRMAPQIITGAEHRAQLPARSGHGPSQQSEQYVDGVTIRRWEGPLPGVTAAVAETPVADAGASVADATALVADAEALVADVIIEAFGCCLPDACIRQFAARGDQPRWFVLEYLSAEAWVEGAHALPSPHPRLPYTRRFWFPGFTAQTGGLLRERGLLASRDAFRSDPAAQRAWWASIAVPPPPGQAELRVSLFCYPNPALPALFDAWADGDRPVTCIVPEGVAAGALDAWTGGAVPHPGGAPLVRGRLRLHVIPFLAQDDYDRLLWACDVNFVRGEDSFVRAQWAARPFAWQIYPQPGRAHAAKLAAFLDRYTAALEAGAAAAARGWMNAWNGGLNAPSDEMNAWGGELNARSGEGSPPPVDRAWRAFLAAWPTLESHGLQWSEHLASLPELAAGLVKATRERV